jgi:hypothetical protein
MLRRDTEQRNFRGTLCVTGFEADGETAKGHCGGMPQKKTVGLNGFFRFWFGGLAKAICGRDARAALLNPAAILAPGASPNLGG